jgi:hypothetical protein
MPTNFRIFLTNLVPTPSLLNSCKFFLGGSLNIKKKISSESLTEFDDKSEPVSVKVVGSVLANDGQAENLTPPDDTGFLKFRFW